MKEQPLQLTDQVEDPMIALNYLTELIKTLKENKIKEYSIGKLKISFDSSAFFPQITKQQARQTLGVEEDDNLY